MRLGYPMAQSGVQSGQFADKYTVRPINRTIMFRISPEERSLNKDRFEDLDSVTRRGGDNLLGTKWQ
jgi:hypothetical protein